jgi:hypothetical protein
MYLQNKYSVEHCKERDRKSKSVEQFNITVNGEKLKDVTKVDNVFSNYFITITEKMKQSTNTERRCCFNYRRLISLKFPPNKNDPSHRS